MPRIGCAGDEMTSAVDDVLDKTEKYLSTAKGFGRLTEDKYDEAISQVEQIREANDKLKCIRDTIPSVSVGDVDTLREDIEDIVDVPIDEET